MGRFIQSLRRIPYWAFVLAFTVGSINTIYFVYLDLAPVSGETSMLVNGHWIIDFIGEDTPVSRTEIRIGDTIVTCNGYPLKEWFSSYHGQKAGDTLIFGIIRGNREVGIPVIIDSYHSTASVYAWALYLFSILFSVSSLYLLVKCPKDKPVRQFFIYIQLLVVVTSNPTFLPFPDMLPVIANMVFIFMGGLFGPVLIHFHLLFPKHALIYKKFRYLPAVFYVAGTLSSGGLFYYYIGWIYFPSEETAAAFILALKYSLFWATTIFLIALIIAIYQFITIQNTLARNQLKLLIIGSFCVFLPLAAFAFFYDWVVGIQWPYFVEMSSAIGNMILILCILIAIFRYRIWDVEVFIRKAMLYLVATAFIILSYLLMIWLVDQFISQESDLTRFLVLGVSVITFLVLRDRIQRLIDRIFHRETYDSATVVSDFEAKLAGIYRLDELKLKIVGGIDDIFHFRTFIFTLKRNGLMYEPVYGFGSHHPMTGSAYEINNELEEKLKKSTVFSPEELKVKPSILEETAGELVVPLLSEGQPGGFFLCGQKKSERTYSRQDIQVLRLLAQRVISLLHTASLYQKDLDRQLMLERERVRISQDMHDDVGASLTRISILSELAKKRSETDGERRQWLEQISQTSRGVMEEMSQIVWALNPKNDTLEGLIAYLRRFANEYLEPASIHSFFELPETMPQIPLSVEVRRNIYLVVREALHNVVKHAGAKQVTISLSLQTISPQGERAKGKRSLISPKFMITISDDGKGFDPGDLEFPGNGLVNMNRRMKDIGGEFEIESALNEGTLITMMVLK